MDERLQSGGGVAGELRALGHEVVGVTSAETAVGPEPMKLAEETSPDAVVASLSAATAERTLQVTGDLALSRRLAVVLVVAPEVDVSLLVAAQDLPFCQIAWEPLRTGELRTALDLAVARQQRLCSMSGGSTSWCRRLRV
ncbi:hypothetical protein [Verrucomicrobium spinosum]|uniref:hypothetical protein n=1 Tax=Verrucomicrobium spinosum TaxID=2736 RepID=UPI0009461D3C|nr:hypothetical protein [Verrucomicrobium spinosum]